MEILVGMWDHIPLARESLWLFTLIDSEMAPGVLKGSPHLRKRSMSFFADMMIFQNIEFMECFGVMLRSDLFLMYLFCIQSDSNDPLLLSKNLEALFTLDALEMIGGSLTPRPPSLGR